MTLRELALALGMVVAAAALARAEPVGRDTIKSRLSDKASDAQRVDDCKVPLERRGDSRRPTACRPRQQTVTQ